MFIEIIIQAIRQKNKCYWQFLFFYPSLVVMFCYSYTVSVNIQLCLTATTTFFVIHFSRILLFEQVKFSKDPKFQTMYRCGNFIILVDRFKNFYFRLILLYPIIIFSFSHILVSSIFYENGNGDGKWIKYQKTEK